MQVCHSRILSRIFEFGSVPRGCVWHTCKSEFGLVYTGLWHTCTLVKKRGRKMVDFLRKPRVCRVGSRRSSNIFIHDRLGPQDLSLETGIRVGGRFGGLKLIRHPLKRTVLWALFVGPPHNSRTDHLSARFGLDSSGHLTMLR